MTSGGTTLARWLGAVAAACALAFCLGSSTAVAASGSGCRPHPGLGSIALLRSGKLHLIDLASCRDRVVRSGVSGRPEFDARGRVHVVARARALRSPDGRFLATVRETGHEQTLRNTIWVRNLRTARSHRVYSVGIWGDTSGLDSPGPIELLGWSGDDRWLFFAIDPGASGSIAADGLRLQVVWTGGGAPYVLGVMLPYENYLAWCGGRLVFTAGADRVATDRKRLLVAGPPDWRPRALVRARGRSWGAPACSPDGRSLVAQEQRPSTDPRFFATQWSLWHVGLDGSMRRLTSPPVGFADESPRFSRDGKTVLFVRSRKGVGQLYALRHGRLVGPLLPLGYSLGYYGRQDWWQSLAWSLAPPGTG